MRTTVYTDADGGSRPRSPRSVLPESVVTIVRQTIAALAVALCLGLMTIVAALAQPVLPQRTALPPNLQALVDIKERTRALGGAPKLAEVRPEPPSSLVVALSNRQATTTKSELLARLARAVNVEAAVYLPGLEADVTSGGPAAAAARRSEYDRARTYIQSLPDGPITVDIPLAHIGSHSISIDPNTWSPTSPYKCCTVLGPITNGWAVKGSSFDVNYDLAYWTSETWAAGGSAAEDAYFFDSIHVGGHDGYQSEASFGRSPSGSCFNPNPNRTPPSGCVFNGLQLNQPLSCPQGVPCPYPGPGANPARYHTRVYDAFVPDVHSDTGAGGFGTWSLGDVHHDNNNHTCSDDYNGSRDRMTNAFRDSSGANLWFVSQITQSNSGNAGYYGDGTPTCSTYYDGILTFVWLSS
jgi:hypothetical protein